MKRILCALLACVLCTSVIIGLSGCGCSNSSQQEPGYQVPATEPDFKNEDFGFFIIENNELMVTEYLGSDTDIKIPESLDNYKVTVIGHSVFNGKNITSVEIPDSIIEIQDYAFSSNQGLTDIKLPKNLKTLGSNVFFNCRNLSSIEFPPTIEDLGLYTFSATGLKSVTIPESNTLTKIDHYTFYQCQNLTEVTLPATITEIAEDAFSDCPNKITIKAPAGSYAQKYAETNKFDFEETK